MGYIDEDGNYISTKHRERVSHKTPRNIQENERLEEQREKHKIDLIQPYDRNGNLNEEFIEYYPEEAKEYGYQADCVVE